MRLSRKYIAVDFRFCPVHLCIILINAVDIFNIKRFSDSISWRGHCRDHWLKECLTVHTISLLSLFSALISQVIWVISSMVSSTENFLSLEHVQSWVERILKFGEVGFVLARRTNITIWRIFWSWLRHLDEDYIEEYYLIYYNSTI